MNKKYVKGRAFEYKIAILFRRKGYYVIRAAGSHGEADLVAVKSGQRPIMIQCKTGDTVISAKECDELFMTAIRVDSTPIVASKADRKPMVFTRLVGLSGQPDGGKVLVKASEF